MRHGACLLLLAGLFGAETADAQGFGFLFDDPPVYRRAPRARRPRPVPVDVPLPVPRPHFAGDDAVPAPTEAEAPPPAETAAETVPLPPERPAQADLAPAPPATPVEGTKPDASKPDTAKPGTTKLGTTKPGTTKQAEAPGATVQTPTPLPPAKPADQPKPPAPTVAASGATTAFDPRDPAPDAGCADRLKARGVVAEAIDIGPQPDPRCIVVQPMRLVSAKLIDGATVTFPDKPTLACITVDAFSAYVHDLLSPLAKGTWGVEVADVWTGPGLECRSRDHVVGAKLSAHGQGLAIDIARLKLVDGRTVAVGGTNTDTERDFETAARAGGCGYFHTVLGPGSDSYHSTHWHFDLEVRGRDGDSKYCK